MTQPGWHMAVLIPARDEEQLLPRCLRSVKAARLLLPRSVTTDIVVVSDRSCDRTEELAVEMLRESGKVVCTDSGNVGSARAAAAATAFARYRGPGERCWFANTDADCEVPRTWLCDQLALAMRGIVAVAGIIDVDSFDEHDSGVPERFRQSYQVYRDGTHPHVHGANMGIRADAYFKCGGWGNIVTAEDHDLWSRLASLGLPSISDATIRVLTSGRRTGRAPSGFADALSAHNGAVA